MTAVVADTHAIIWYRLGSARLSERARKALNVAESIVGGVNLPSICLVEMVYLLEKGRIPQAAWDRLEQGLSSHESTLRIVALDADIARAVARISRDEIADMPDRIIAATALHLGLPPFDKCSALYQRSANSETGSEIPSTRNC